MFVNNKYINEEYIKSMEIERKSGKFYETVGVLKCPDHRLYVKFPSGVIYESINNRSKFLFNTKVDEKDLKFLRTLDYCENIVKLRIVFRDGTITHKSLGTIFEFYEYKHENNEFLFTKKKIVTNDIIELDDITIMKQLLQGEESEIIRLD